MEKRPTNVKKTPPTETETSPPVPKALAQTEPVLANDNPKNSPTLGETAMFESAAPGEDEAAELFQGDNATQLEEPASESSAPPSSAASATSLQLKPAAGLKSEVKGQKSEVKGQKVATLGDYQILKKLGQGGMGTVYQAKQISLDRIVALKVLSRELASRPGFVERFQREARVMARLDHPNILRCYEIKECGGSHYLAMEFVDGGSLEGILEKHTKLSLGDALHLILACARGLEHAHEQNLVHRDVKPDNILLTSKGVIKVADLGLAKAQDDDLGLTQTGTGAGTPLYMSPEQARDVKHVDARSDIYALGCMLYRMLSGEFPFKGETLVGLTEAKEKGKFTPVRRFNHEIPERLDLMLDKMLATNPKHRFQSCTEVIQMLEGLGLANERLSFLGGPAGAPARPTPHHPPATPAARPAARAVPSPAAAPPPAHVPEAMEYWYVVLKQGGGKTVTKKVTRADLTTLVKANKLSPDTQVSRSLKGGYRDLATYPQFESLLRAKMSKEKADHKADKFKSLYNQIAKEEESRRRWGWLKNLMKRTGSFVGLLIWLALVGAIGVGAFFLLRHVMGDKFPF